MQTALARTDGLPVDLLLSTEGLTFLGMRLAFDPDSAVLPGLLRAELLRAPPSSAAGGRLYRLRLPEGKTAVVPIGNYAELSLSAAGDHLVLGVPALALPFLGKVRTYEERMEVLPGGQRLIHLNLPRNKAVQATLAGVKVAVRIPDPPS